ncbi:MAG: hypothetical protein ABL963_12165 [Longimicrobiales bacterium]
MSTPFVARPVQNVVRVALVAVATLGLTVFSANAAQGQSTVPQARAWEFRVPGGAFVPTGDQRDALDDAHVTAIQVSRVLRPQLAVTGTFGWARSHDLVTVGAPKLDVFTSDIGIEARSAERSIDGPVAISLFAGLGGGIRSYNHRNLHVDASHNLAGYGSVGAELGMGRVGVRVEVRDYVSGFEHHVGVGGSDVRNDMVMTVALRFNRQRSSQNQN